MGRPQPAFRQQVQVSGAAKTQVLSRTFRPANTTLITRAIIRTTPVTTSLVKGRCSEYCRAHYGASRKSEGRPKSGEYRHVRP